MVSEQPAQDSRGFSQQWLSLREPADHAARSAAITEALIAWTRQKRTVRVMDLGTGTGSNLRYLCPLLGHDQHWTLVDNDAQLLSQVPGILLHWGASNGITVQRSGDTLHLSSAAFSATVQWQQTDLANELPCLPFAATDLVTASALLDLTSGHWLDQLATQCIEQRCASLFVLNYDGRIEWQPANEQDALMRQRLNQHQLNDKGFGTALGPQAGHYLVERLQPHQQVTLMTSDWILNSQYRDLQRALLEGWTDAVIEQDADAQASIEQWRTFRDLPIGLDQSSLTVGHSDVLALPRAADQVLDTRLKQPL